MRLVGIFVPWQAVVAVLALVVGLTTFALGRDGGERVVRLEQASANSDPADSTTSTVTGESTTTSTAEVDEAGAVTSPPPIATTTPLPSAAAATTIAPSTTITAPIAQVTSPPATSPPVTPVPTAPPTTTTTTPPCTASTSGGVANLRVTRVGRNSADIDWDCYPGIDPATNHHDGAYYFERKGGSSGTEWSGRVAVYSGTRAMPAALDADTVYWFRVAPVQPDGQPGQWEEISLRTNP